MKKGGAERVFTAGWHAVGLVSPSCLLPVLPYNSSCMPSLVLPMRHDVPCATADLAALRSLVENAGITRPPFRAIRAFTQSAAANL